MAQKKRAKQRRWMARCDECGRPNPTHTAINGPEDLRPCKCGCFYGTYARLAV